MEGVTTLLLERGLDAVSVVDGEGRLVGVVSAADLLRDVEEHGDGVAEQVPLRTVGRRGVRARLGPGFHADLSAETKPRPGRS